MNTKKKSNPRLLTNDIYKFVSQQSSLSINQVAECFRVYAKLIMNLLENEDRPSDLTISLPSLGVFSFYTVKGYKKGDVINYPLYNGKDGTYTMTKKIFEEDEPDYEKIRFIPRNKCQITLKEVAKKKANKKPLNFDFAKKDNE